MVSRQVEIIPEPLDLMHPLMEDRNDADIAAREAAPIDKMLLVAEKISVDAKLCWNRPGHHATALDLLERFEHPRDVAIRLFGAPSIAGVSIDVVETVGCRLLDAYASPVRFGCER